jgi:hypothetical protein
MESDQYVLLWSHSQQITHSCTVAEMLKANREAVIENKPNDFVVMAIAATREAANAQAKPLQDLRAKRESQTP